MAYNWDWIKTNRDVLGAWFMLPAAGFLLLFLAYPLGLGIWMSFTDARIGRSGSFIGLENYEWLLDDNSFINATLFTIAYTVGRERVQVRHRPLPRASAQQENPVPVDRAGGDPDPLHRADGALGHRLLVDLRPAVLDHLMVACGRWG